MAKNHPETGEKKGLKTFTNVGAWTTGKNGQSEKSYETSVVGNNDDGFYAVDDRSRDDN